MLLTLTMCVAKVMQSQMTPDKRDSLMLYARDCLMIPTLDTCAHAYTRTNQQVQVRCCTFHKAFHRKHVVVVVPLYVMSGSSVILWSGPSCATSQGALTYLDESLELFSVDTWWTVLTHPYAECELAVNWTNGHRSSILFFGYLASLIHTNAERTHRMSPARGGTMYDFLQHQNQTTSLSSRAF